MAYGAQIQNTSGLTRLTITDFIHRLVQSGVITNLGIYGTNNQFIPVTGMTVNDEWMVLSTYSCITKLGSGGFYISNYTDSFVTQYYYSVWRR